MRATRVRAASHWPVGIGTSLLLFALFACGFDETELDCERALAHLVACDPSCEVSAFCSYRGCQSQQPPDLTLAGSECLLAKDCADIVRYDYCALVAESDVRGVPVDPERCNPLRDHSVH